MVSEQPVEILSCADVADLYGCLNLLIENGKIDFKKYSKDSEYVEMINQHITNRLERFNILDNPSSKMYKFLKKQFPDIVKSISKKE